MKKFKVGDTYQCSGLYGTELVIRIVSRTDDEIDYYYVDDPQTLHSEPIVVFCDIEHIEAWEYRGSKGYWNANCHDGYNGDDTI